MTACAGFVLATRPCSAHFRVKNTFAQGLRMTTARDHYEVLGVSRDSSAEEIRSAFKKAASAHHPDRNPNDPDAAQRFKDVNSAYQVLSDPQRRSMYDRFGHRGEESGSPFGPNGPFAGGVVDFTDLNVDGFLGDLLGVFGVGRGDKGDIKRDISVTFEQAAFGCDREFQYDRAVPCTDCQGSGAAAGSNPVTCIGCQGSGKQRIQQGLFPIAVERTCPSCKGRGRTVLVACTPCRGVGLVHKKASLRLTLPPGVEEGATKLVEGAGNRPAPNRAPGDLEITIHVEPHAFFRRSGDDVLCQVPITFAQAALGGEVTVPTLDGKGALRVPPGTQPSARVRMKGKGIPKRVGSGRGDQVVEVMLEVPTSLTAKQRELVEQLAKELGEEVQPQQRTFVEKLKHLFG
jgi:molecular chaperone DnaJ